SLGVHAVRLGQRWDDSRLPLVTALAFAEEVSVVTAGGDSGLLPLTPAVPAERKESHRVAPGRHPTPFWALWVMVLLALVLPAHAAITLGAHSANDNGSTSNSTVGCAMTQVAAGSLVTAEVSFSGAVSFTSVADNHNAGNYTAAVAAHLNSTI